MYNNEKLYMTDNNKKQVGFRLNSKLLEKIDQEAELNYRDRTEEITNAISGYYKINAEREALVVRLSALTERVDRLEKEFEILKKK